MIVSEFLAGKLQEMRQELEAMRPAYESYVELQRAISALEKTLEGGKTRGRPKGEEGKSRSDQVMHLVKAEPGIAVNAIAQKLGTARSYLDRVLRSLEKEGKIERRPLEGEGRDQWGFWVK